MLAELIGVAFLPIALYPGRYDYEGPPERAQPRPAIKVDAMCCMQLLSAASATPLGAAWIGAYPGAVSRL
jgi:hypothetical protein